MNRIILSARKTAQTATTAPVGKLMATAALLLTAVGGVAVQQGVTPFGDIASAAGPTADDPWSVRADGLLRDDPWKASATVANTDDPWKASATVGTTDDPWV
ncbi:hypothetical protein [Streptomyces sp. NBC_00503]|uniref:hypothetical protein n=1 Tax=Streptomyces sp. NBC_00503 TaxID=2903659 RepID=UPI002E815E1B|nr:hypothetical protein [Streptomyces sp. NBC_00503]WUD86313.1 hypothetical protein OG490_37490 [Streptomyces sp. NBC_00503]